MKMIIIAGLLLLVAGNVCAENVCKKKEYAELKDMNKKELIAAFIGASKICNAEKAWVFAPSEPIDETVPKTVKTAKMFSQQGIACCSRVDDYKKQLTKRFKFSSKQIAALNKKSLPQ